MEGAGVDGRFGSHPAFRATRKPRHPQQNTPYRPQRKSAKTRSDNSGSIGVIGAAVQTRGAGSHFKPPPRTGEPAVVSSLNLYLLPLPNALFRGGLLAPLINFSSSIGTSVKTPRKAPNDERNRAQERSLFPQWRPCWKVILGCVTPLSLCF